MGFVDTDLTLKVGMEFLASDRRFLPNRVANRQGFTFLYSRPAFESGYTIYKVVKIKPRRL